MKISIFLAGALALVAVQPVWAESISQMEVEGKKSLTPAKKRHKFVEGQVDNIPYLNDFVILKTGQKCHSERSEESPRYFAALRYAQYDISPDFTRWQYSPTRTVKGWLSQANSAVIQVTGVKANPTDQGVEILLETSQGDQLQLTNRSTSNSYIVDIANAQLLLPSGEAFTFRSEKPIAGITEITVTNQDANTIRVSIIGETSLPSAELFDSEEGLIFGLAPVVASSPPQQPATPSEDETQPEQPSAAAEEPIELVVTGVQDRYLIPNSSTATRTNTPLRDIPQGIQIIPRQVIEDQQVTRLDEALRNTSGVTFGGTGFGRDLLFNVRGFERTQVLRDGFNQFRNGGIPETANLQQIEILKGPASVLYGDIQPGGVINLVTKKPLSEPFYEIQTQFGSRGLFRPSIDVSGPLTTDGNLLYRLNALYQTSESFQNVDNNVNRFFISPVLSWKISDNTDFTLEVESLNDRRPSSFGVPAFGNRVANIPFDRIISEPDDVVKENFFKVGYTLEHRFSENWKLNNAFRYLQQNILADVAYVSSVNETNGIAERNWAIQTDDSRNYSFQTNIAGEFTTGPIKHKLLTGIDLSRVDQFFFTRFDFATSIPIDIFNPVYRAFARPRPEDLPILNDSQTKTDRLGFYLQDQLSLSDNLIVLAGFRYDTVNQTNRNNQFGSEQTQYSDAFSPRIGIVYKPIEEVSLYTSYSRSFSPNAGITVNNDVLQPERGEGYEVGVKAELLRGRLSTTLAYFDITKQNVANSDLNAPGFGFSVATGEQKSQGIEFDVVGEIIPGWNVIASYAYIDAEVTKDNTTPIGNQLAGIPKHSANFWTTYEIQKGGLQGLGLGLGLNYVGSRAGDLQNSFEVDSYWLTNAAIFYRKDRWRVGLNFKNIFDIDYISGVSTATERGNDPGEPFTVVGSISLTF
ncbi:TonB-dependent siderophore receptor [Anabaena cylindrica UHCC 0172]|uniref:TonB-dependent siderophore receptor n=1 Tax=Anabaena cylindrica TaxID=1165 RepID=UPI002B202E2D|nr:TonB-dependent siderophore receptor [Anabaena cylindrica]MEA5552702.1 TonB-dependent siderophore receptor [Anabaena cylindrica UHCC 0172]